MKAIETQYKGYRFRSRLEARWAVFFDTLGVKWEYEKEGYNLDGEGYYLPDFYLPNVSLRTIAPQSEQSTGIWIEIKGVAANSQEKRLCWALAKHTQKPVLLCVGLPSNPNSAEYNYDNFQQFAVDYLASGGEWWDNYMVFLQCINCHGVKVEYMEGNYYECEKCKVVASDETPLLLKAFEAARSARFEHGESPKVF